MSTLTPNLNLVKPDGTDNINIGTLNNNFNIIDSEIGNLKEDYVVAQGFTGGWTWRRWASGLGECWCRHAQKTNYNYGINYTVCTVGTYPFKFIETPVISANFSITGRPYGSIAHTDTSLTSPDIYADNQGQTEGLNCVFNIRAIGRWK